MVCAIIAVKKTQLCTALQSSTGQYLDRLSTCTAALQNCFWCNDLLLNPDKYDAAMFGTRPELKSRDYHRPFWSHVVQSSWRRGRRYSELHYIRLYPFTTMLMKWCEHAIVLSLPYLRHLTFEVANTLACIFEGFRIDCCNPLLVDHPSRHSGGFCKCRTVSHAPHSKSEYVNYMVTAILRTYLLRDLHWSRVGSP